MSTHPYIPLYVDDFEAATAHLTVEEDGVYNRLLRLCWRTPGCSLPNDHAWIARKIRLSVDDFERIGKPVLAEFFSLVRGRLVQRRLRSEYDDISRKKSARAAAGKKGGAAKALKTHDNAASNASTLPPDTRAFPEPYPEPDIDHPPKSASAPDWSARLDEAKSAGAEGVDLTSPAIHTYRDLRSLCEPTSGEPCEWGEVLDAIRHEAAKAAQKGKPLRTWQWVSERALTFRDRRLAGLPPARGQRPAEPTGPLGEDWPESRWAIAVDLWRTDGKWEPRLGPEPGKPGCRVPANLLIEPAAPVKGVA